MAFEFNNVVTVQSMRTSKIMMSITFINGEKHSVRELVLLLISFSVSERKFSLVRYGCSFSIYTWGV